MKIRPFSFVGRARLPRTAQMFGTSSGLSYRKPSSRDNRKSAGAARGRPLLNRLVLKHPTSLKNPRSQARRINITIACH